MSECVYLITEAHVKGKGKDREVHIKQVCALSMSPCLIDSPSDRAGCTRIAWAEFQKQASSQPKPKDHGEQIALL